MTQAYPQFTPVQILEAGQRAIADGRHEYAAQFFQHLVDHYSETPEAGRAREVLARLNSPTAPQYVNGNNSASHAGTAAQATPSTGDRRGPQLAPDPGLGSLRPARSNASALQPDNLQAGGAQAGGPPAGNTQHAGSPPYATQVRASAHPPAHQERREPAFGTPPAAQEFPSTLSRHDPPAPPAQHQSARHQQGHHQHAQRSGHTAAPSAGPIASPQPVPQRLYIPAPEKHYIVGRVIAGMLLLLGIIGVFAGIGLIFAAVSDPKIFSIVGATGPVAALTFAISVFIGSMALLIISQVATAVFNGADAVGDLARLERYRAGDYDDEE